MDNKQLILKVDWTTEKLRNKAKKISENFEIRELPYNPLSKSPQHWINFGHLHFSFFKLYFLKNDLS